MKKQSKLTIGIIAGILLIADIVIAAVLILWFSNSNVRNYARHMESAQRYMDELQYEQAIAEYKAAIEIEPNNAEAYQALAGLYVQMGDYESAIAVLNQGIEQTGSEELSECREETDKERYNSYLVWAQEYEDGQDYESAIEMYGMLLDINTNNVEMYITIARLYEQAGDNESAKNILRQGIEQIDSEELSTYMEEMSEQAEEPGAEPEPVDWLEAHGITITPQGDCQVTVWGGEEDGVTFVSDYDAAVNVTISETEEGADEGFKKVSALFTIDFSNNPGNYVKYWSSSFDRYTGTSFEFDGSVIYTNQGDHVTTKGYTTIQNGDEYYDVSIEFSSENQYPLFYKTITVTCPVDYDGTVFQIGYSSPELDEQNSQIDFSARLYSIDELPFFGDGYLYFTMNNE